MIKFKTGDIFTSECQALVNPVNTVGVMSKGLAKEFKNRFPQMFEDYKISYSTGKRIQGQIHQWIDPTTDRIIINFPTKQHWQERSDILTIRMGLVGLEDLISKKAPRIDSIAFPKLGCGLGGLDWEKQVKPLMLTSLKGLENILTTIEVYE